MSPQESPDVQNLNESIQRLSDAVRLLCDVVDEVREELSWLTRNGLPQPALSEHVLLKRMAADPTASDWRDRLELVTSDSEPRASAPSEADETVRALVEQLETGIAAIATDQLALFIDALDENRDAIIAALTGQRQQELSFSKAQQGTSPVEPCPVLETGDATNGGEAADGGQRRLF